MALTTEHSSLQAARSATVTALFVLPMLVFLGTVTFVRIIATGIEDAIYAQAIGRIRHYYLELAGDDARYFPFGGRDDLEGALAFRRFVHAPHRFTPIFRLARDRHRPSQRSRSDDNALLPTNGGLT